MKKFPKPLLYIVMVIAIFVLGWEASSYYVSTKLGAANNSSHTEDVGPISPFAPLINSNDQADLTTFWQVWKMLFDTYVEEEALQKQQMVYGAIKGMVASLNDPYTVYMTPDETKDFDENLAGELEGIGAELTVRDQNLVIVSPIKNSPAEKAGLLPGDIVYKIDGNLTAEMTLFDAIMHIRGQKGTKVVLTIIREKMEEPFDLAIMRDTVKIESVTLEEMGEGIYHLSINQFNDNTKPEFEEEISELILKEPKGLILDLRYNGGGYLDTAVDIVAEFVSGKKPAVTIKRRDESNNETLYVDGRASLPEVQIVVLINNGSASASEIVAGALQDYKRAIVMGVQSFGKGSVQEVDKLSDGSSLRMTIAKWYTPNGNNIDGVGIKPDIIVEMKSEDIDKDMDSQLEAAENYLKKL